MKSQRAWKIAFLGLAACLLLIPSKVPAQSQITADAEANPRLNEQEMRGSGIFLQRCSLCHLPKLTRPYKPFGPILTGVLKGAPAAKENIVRQLILLGSEKMPGFRYGLSTSEMDDLIAYLKTL
ncbi:MAG: hypothetical protein A3H27_18115 [Acidobacteria bacterium RIFCSPLOWO2_02_FULL_59_13]|nr:MAG: hypothetical protein A3H27_18115 [Acidobacteria bacterium RIFCSPLOWO2_02_FULL_59_13]